MCLLPQWDWYLVDWPLPQWDRSSWHQGPQWDRSSWHQRPAIICAQQFMTQCVVLRASQTQPSALRTPVGLTYSSFVTRGHVSYKKYLTYTSTILLTTLKISWSKEIEAVFIGNVRFLEHDTLYIYICYPNIIFYTK